VSYRCRFPLPALRLAATLCCLVPLAGLAGAPEEGAPAAGAKDPVGPTIVEVTTSMGSFTLQLDAEKAPVTVANFLRYVASGHYDGTVFHRVVGGYMVQGGGFEKKGDQLVEKPTEEPIKNEADNELKNTEGAIAMARTDAPDTATAQFFINCRDNEMLDRSPASAGYAVFGRVTKGMEVVMQINGAKTGVREVQGRLGNGQLRPMPLKSVPLDDVVIESVSLVGTKAQAESGQTEEPVAPEKEATAK
jgi:cyclophilin family peptidyl-prolyl cis-trans isomerase